MSVDIEFQKNMGRYELQQPFAQGAQSRIFRAFDRILRKNCLLKTGISAEKEALLARELCYPSIAQPYDLGNHPDFGKFAVYEEICGYSILEWRRSSISLRILTLQIAEFLAFLHQRGWLYNDFKPEHFILVGEKIQVVDLGLCSPLTSNGHSPTYSGSFPFISPERMQGRASEAPSDIFALGVLISFLLRQSDEWPAEPSLSFLLEIPARARQLRGFWKKLLPQMTSFEPAQRIQSADELWQRLLPRSARQSFLVLPPRPRSVPDPLFDKTNVLLARSKSEIRLKEVETRAIVTGWKSGYSTIFFDLTRSELQECLCLLGSTRDGAPAVDVFSALQHFHQSNSDQKSLIVFHCAQKLSLRQRSFLAFAISRLCASDSIRILITTTESLGDPQENWKCLDIPCWTKKDLEEMIPANVKKGVVRRHFIVGFNKGSVLIPEDVYSELQKQLPKHAPFAWPSTAKLGTKLIAFEQLSTSEKRVLANVAIAGGLLPQKYSGNLLRIGGAKLRAVTQRLSSYGYLQDDEDTLTLRMAPSSILMRFRKNQIETIAVSLLKKLSAKDDLRARYFTANRAGNKKGAAAISLQMAAETAEKVNLHSSMKWLWRAFLGRADVSKHNLFRLAKYFLNESRGKRAFKLITHIRQRFGLSYRLGDLILDYYYRQDRLELASNIARQLVRQAEKHGHRIAVDYFSLRLAGFLVLQSRFEAAEEITEKIKAQKDLTAPVEGLLHHYLGLDHLCRRRLEQAVHEFRLAVKSKQRFRSSSWMNLGITLGKLERFGEAEICIERAIRMLSKEQRAVSLPHAYNNLGILKKKQGRISEARESYRRCLFLSQSQANLPMCIAACINLATTYALEGRTKRGIYYYCKAARLARGKNLEDLKAFALSNLGLQYAVQGELRKALLALRKSITLRKRLEAPDRLALGYEYLGISYFLFRRYSRAREYLSLAADLFAEIDAPTDLLRVRCYLSLMEMQSGNFSGSSEWLNLEIHPMQGTLEDGLLNLAKAVAILNSPPFEASKCRQYLHQAELAFRSAPDLFWLAKLHLAKSQYFEKSDHYEKAVISMNTASNIFERLGANGELRYLEKTMTKMKIPENLLEKIAEKLPFRVLLLIKEVLSEKNRDRMISRILNAALEFTDMERAVLILETEPPRIFKSCGIDESSVDEICQISRSATESVADHRESLICTDVATDSFLCSRPSILANRIVSIVCLPLRAESKLLGFLYLDSREGVETLATADKLLLEIFAAIIASALNSTLALERSHHENEKFRASLGMTPDSPQIIGSSKPMVEVLTMTHRLLNNDLPVLITGETGTGKELIARVLHFCGSRKAGPFVAVNCPALSESLLESELFGHEKGSFTGATNLKIGVFEEARNGTLLLDEIGDLPQAMQVKFLRVLQEGEFRRVGGTKTLRTNARLVFATNQNIEELVKQRRFREDLYYRIRVAHLHVPPLRERQQDITELASFFLRTLIGSEGRQVRGFSPEAIEFIQRYSWPGNVRELKSEIERIVALCDHEWILPSDFDSRIRQSISEADAAERMATLREMERELILQRLQRNEWNIVHTAKSLGLTRNGLYSKMKMYNISKHSDNGATLEIQ